MPQFYTSNNGATVLRDFSEAVCVGSLLSVRVSPAVLRSLWENKINPIKLPYKIKAIINDIILTQRGNGLAAHQ